MTTQGAEHQVELAMRSLALSARPMTQRLEGALIDLGVIVAEDLPETSLPLFREIEQISMARGRVEATIAAMSDAEREALAAKIYQLYEDLIVKRDGRPG